MSGQQTQSVVPQIVATLEGQPPKRRRAAKKTVTYQSEPVVSEADMRDNDTDMMVFSANPSVAAQSEAAPS